MITEYMAEYLIKYLKDGANNKHTNGFCNFFDVGYKIGSSWTSALNQKEEITTVRFDNALNPEHLICEGRIPPEHLNLAGDYAGKNFYIRVYDMDNSSSCVAEIPMSSIVQDYFRGYLSATIEIILQWEISFSEEE